MMTVQTVQPTLNSLPKSTMKGNYILRVSPYGEGEMGAFRLKSDSLGLTGLTTRLDQLIKRQPFRTRPLCLERSPLCDSVNRCV